MQNHHISKRKKRAIRFFTYGMMTFAVVTISTVCLLLLLGYQFDGKNGTLAQGGLLQFRNSFPSSATIELDGQRLGFKTPGKYNVSSGEHSVVMRLDNYQEWRKTFFVQPGELKWLNYARFIPNNLTTTSLATFPSVSDALPSPDRKWYALQTDPTQPTVTVYDVRKPEAPVAISLQIPTQAFTEGAGQPHQFTLEEWDFGGRYILVRHQVGQTTEYIRLDRTVANGGVNLTRTFNLPLTAVHFSGTSGNIFYGLNGTDIRRIDLGDRTISQPLAGGVETFELYGSETIAFVAVRNGERLVGVYIDDKETIVRSYPLDQPVFAGITAYFDRNYLAIVRGTEVEIIKNPQEASALTTAAYATFSDKTQPRWLKLSNGGRFVTTGRGVAFTTYDLETREVFTASFDGQRADEDRPLQWIDDYYFAADTNDLVTIGEFDGMNRHEIVRAVAGLPVTLSEDGTFLFSIGRSESGAYTLQSTRMTID